VTSGIVADFDQFKANGGTCSSKSCKDKHDVGRYTVTKRLGVNQQGMGGRNNVTGEYKSCPDAIHFKEGRGRTCTRIKKETQQQQEEEEATPPSNARFVRTKSSLRRVSASTPPRFMATAASLTAMPPTCHKDQSTCKAKCRKPDFGAHCDTKKRGSEGQNIVWCCHNPHPGCFANPSDAAAHCKVPRKSDGAKKQSPDMTKCGEYVYCCDDKCPGGDAEDDAEATTKPTKPTTKGAAKMAKASTLDDKARKLGEKAAASEKELAALLKTVNKKGDSPFQGNELGRDDGKKVGAAKGSAATKKGSAATKKKTSTGIDLTRTATVPEADLTCASVKQMKAKASCFGCFELSIVPGKKGSAVREAGNRRVEAGQPIDVVLERLKGAEGADGDWDVVLTAYMITYNGRRVGRKVKQQRKKLPSGVFRIEMEVEPLDYEPRLTLASSMHFIAVAHKGNSVVAVLDEEVAVHSPPLKLVVTADSLKRDPSTKFAAIEITAVFTNPLTSMDKLTGCHLNLCEGTGDREIPIGDVKKGATTRHVFKGLVDMTGAGSADSHTGRNNDNRHGITASIECKEIGRVESISSQVSFQIGKGSTAIGIEDDR
jgi:hypothetical protein